MKNSGESFGGSNDISEYDVPEYDLPDYVIPEYDVPDYVIPEYDVPEYDVPDYVIPEYDVPEYINKLLNEIDNHLNNICGLNNKLHTLKRKNNLDSADRKFIHSLSIEIESFFTDLKNYKNLLVLKNIKNSKILNRKIEEYEFYVNMIKNTFEDVKNLFNFG